MGGGDLNSKKSWHPNTMKNQERVWKAEQAAAEEKQRILELQRERSDERDHAKLKEMVQHNFGSSSLASENRLHWMYDKPDKKVQQEDYLLGKAIDKSDQLEKTEQGIIPAVARRVIGSSMLTTGDDSQVDLVRKIREDPLLLVKERERAARAALLNNPLQRRRLTELLRKDQEQRKESKIIKKSKKKDKDLDNMLVAKLNALGGEKGIDLATLLDSEESSSVSLSDEEKSKKNKKKLMKLKKNKKKSKKKKKAAKIDTDSSENEKKSSDRSQMKCGERTSSLLQMKHKTEHKKQKTEAEEEGSFDQTEAKKIKRGHPSDNYHKGDNQQRGDSRRATVRNMSPQLNKGGIERNHRERKCILSEEQRAARLSAMAEAGASREVERGRRVASQRAAAAEPAPSRAFRNEARALPDSLESRIHSNRHYIQRDRRHMNEHFARR